MSDERKYQSVEDLIRDMLIGRHQADPNVRKMETEEMPGTSMYSDENDETGTQINRRKRTEFIKKVIDET